MTAESLRDKLGKILRRKCIFKLARSQKHCIGARRRYLADILKSEALRQNIVHSAVGTVEVSVGTERIHAVLCEQIDRVMRSEIFYRVKYDRVVAHYKLRPGLVRLFDCVGGYIEHNGGSSYFALLFSDEQTDIVPRLMHFKRTERIERIIDITDNSHYFSPPFKNVSIPRQAFSQYSASSGFMFALRRDTARVISRLCCLSTS